MIDPRALQQHFKKVHQRQVPKQQMVPQITNTLVLTSLQTIIQPEPIHPKVDTSELQKEILEITQAFTTFKQSLTQIPQIETITVPVSVTTVVTEIKEQTQEKDENSPYGYSILKQNSNSEEYNPYGYYSGPTF